MAEGCVQSSCNNFDKVHTIDWDVDAICNHIIEGNIVYDKKRLFWRNSYELLRKVIESTFVQRGKWHSAGGSAKRFESSVSDFNAIWYPGKMKCLTFNGKIGEQAGAFLTNLCEAMSTSSEPNVSVHEQTELHPKLSMENFGLDLEILESRVDSMQSLINTHEVLLVEARDLVNEITRISLELKEEKFKNFRLEQQINILNNVVMKSKLGSRKASLAMNTRSTLGTNNNVQVSTISENNGSQTKDTNSLASVPLLIKQSKVHKIINQKICKYQQQRKISISN